MSTNCINPFLNALSGTSQEDRTAAAPNPASVQLNDLSWEDYMQLAYNFAKEVKYFGTRNPEQAIGDWQTFFISGDAKTLQNYLEQGEKEHTITPHLALFISFLRLLEHSKNRFNTITTRHLDFYYSEVLKIAKKPAQNDQVHLLFELAKNIESYALPEATQAVAGKDEHNKPLLYATEQTTVINKAQLANIRSIYKDPITKVLKATQKTNMLDGIDQELKEEKFWMPFGYPKTFKNRPELPNATLGFALAATVLNLESGLRQVLISTFFKESKKLDSEELINLLEVFVTGEKGWIGPIRLHEKGSYPGFETSSESGIINFAFSLEAWEKAIIGFDEAIHTGNFKNGIPVVKLQLSINSTESYDLAQSLSELTLDDVEIAVAVDGLTTLDLSNDIGNLSASKPFYPFGPRPFEKSRFKINCSELTLKNWLQINLRLNWLNLPQSFSDHYLGYRSGTINSTRAFVESIYKIGSKTEVTELAKLPKTWNSDLDNLIVESNDHFTAQITIADENRLFTTSQSKDAHPLFTEGASQTDINIKSLSENGIQSGAHPIELTLNTSFYHTLYPKLYALALAAQDPEVIIPNEPYTPLLESLELSYYATQRLDLTSDKQAEETDQQLNFYQIHPYGVSMGTTVFPQYEEGGYLYLAFENAQPGAQVSFLFQLQEGTENPLKESFAEQEKIEWSVLTASGWQALTDQEILREETDNFLKTGIITLALPESASTESLLMPKGFIWLQAHTSRAFDVVCRFINIHTQVVKAHLASSSIQHLKNGLPAESISKLNTRVASVKKVMQPYSSFNGRTQESQADYYRRVSERLRHKDRALNLWDYEHLVLQNFPEVYKVKCLNHTCKTKFKAAGKVTLVVIPNTVNKPVFDLFEPRCSTAKLNEIQEFLIERTSYFITPQIINPQYEPVSVALKVKFHKGYDEHHYKNELQEAVKKWLSPWAYEEDSLLTFGVSINKSMLISHLEQLSYVDYLSDVVLMHQATPKNEIVPSSPKAILVSAKTHTIELAKSTCKSNENTVLVSC